MSESAPVPYPTASFAYPVAKPEAAFAPPVPAFAPESAPTQEPVAIESPSTAASTFIEQPIAQPEPLPAQSKFFPLVPVETSKFVGSGVIDAAGEPKKIQDNELIDETVEPQVEARSPLVNDSIEIESPFDISSSLTREPQTNSIVLDEIPDALTSADIVTDAGQILATGSIELPTLTGEIKIVSDSPNADIADDLDSASVNISTVAPVRAPSVINSKAQLGVLPSKRRKNQGQLMAMLTLAIMIVTVGTLYALAAILGIIK